MTDRKRMEASAGSRLALIAESFERLMGSPLVPRGADLWSMPRALAAHGTEEVPLFFFANALALELFALPADRFIGMPSHESAEPSLRAERAAMLARLERDDVVTDYSGVRLAANGRRFRIERATIWNLLDERGIRHGQAATFAEWTPLPGDSPLS
jgi:hypothetical protein